MLYTYCTGIDTYTHCTHTLYRTIPRPDTVIYSYTDGGTTFNANILFKYRLSVNISIY